MPDETPKAPDIAADIEKRLEAKFSAFTSQVASLLDKIPAAAIQPTPAPAPAPAPKGQPAGDEDPERNALLQRMQTLEEQLKTQREAAETQRQQARGERLRNAVVEQLGRAGISGPAAKHALHSLMGDGLIAFESDKSDKLVFRSQSGTLPLADGLEQWAGSDDATYFRPPSGAAGSGSSPTRSGGDGPARKTSDAELAAAIRRGIG